MNPFPKMEVMERNTTIGEEMRRPLGGLGGGGLRRAQSE